MRISFQVLIEELATQELVVGLFLLGTGLVYMLLGSRMFNGLVAVTYGVIGFVAGASLPLEGAARLLPAFAGAVALAITSTFAMKGAVAVLAGGWTALVLSTAGEAIGLNSQGVLMLAIFGFAGAVSLTFIIYDEIIATVTSLQGALLCIGGLITFIAHSPSVWGHVKSLLVSSPIFGPFMVIAGTVTGLCLQLSDMRQKDTGVSV